MKSLLQCQLYLYRISGKMMFDNLTEDKAKHHVYFRNKLFETNDIKRFYNVGIKSYGHLRVLKHVVFTI